LDFDAGFVKMVVKTTTDKNNTSTKKKRLSLIAEHEIDNEDESDDTDEFELPDYLPSESETEDETD
jgi:hypothetical protein